MAGATCAPEVHAQASAAVSVTSQYSVRGIPLSDGRPVPQLGLAYDTPQGGYAGVFASPVVLREHANSLQFVPYAGYASRWPSGLTWDVGVTSAVFSGAAEYNYGEVYGGLAADHVSVRLYLAPAYYGSAGRAAYGEVNGFYPWYEHVKLLAHVGVLHTHSPNAGTRDRADIRFAASIDAGGYSVQLAWLPSVGRRPATGPPGARLRLIAVSVSYPF